MTIYFKNLDLSKINKDKSQKRRRQPLNSFPMKLYKMLNEVASDGKEDIIGWTQDGMSFQLRDKTRFMNEVMPNYFNQSKYKSFQRQLNFYGFHSTNSGPNERAYSHEWFMRGNIEMCKKIRRLDTLSKHSGDSTSIEGVPASSSQSDDSDDGEVFPVPPINDRQESIMTFDPRSLAAGDDELNSLLQQAMPTTKLTAQESVILEGAKIAFGGRTFCFLSSHKNFVE